MTARIMFKNFQILILVNILINLSGTSQEFEENSVPQTNEDSKFEKQNKERSFLGDLLWVHHKETQVDLTDFQKGWEGWPGYHQHSHYYTDYGTKGGYGSGGGAALLSILSNLLLWWYISSHVHSWPPLPGPPGPPGPTVPGPSGPTGPTAILKKSKAPKSKAPKAPKAPKTKAPITIPPVTIPPIPPIMLPPISLPPITVPGLPPISLPPISVPPISLPPIGRRNGRIENAKGDDMPISKTPEEKTRAILEIIQPHLAIITGIEKGILPLKCSFKANCLANRIFMDELGPDFGLQIGIILSHGIIKVLGLRKEHKDQILKSGEMGRFGGNCFQYNYNCDLDWWNHYQ